MKSQKFYQESWFVILMLVVFFPVGLFLMWRHKKFNFAARVVISIVVGLVLIGVNNNDEDSKASETSSSHTTPQIEEEVQPIPTEEPVIVSTPEPTPTEEELFQEWISGQFSVWNGSHIELVNLVKENMNDPKSFEHVETRYGVDEDGTSINIYMKFRGNNAFGGKIINEVLAKADYETNIVTITDWE